MPYQSIETSRGTFPALIPNTVIDAGSFYVSYNDHDLKTYEGDTTALVVGQMERFYILKGDHREEYKPLLALGLDACIAYFKEHFDQAHGFSTKKAIEELGLPQPQMPEWIKKRSAA